MYLIYLNCHAQYGSHVTNYDITISKKGLKMYCQNTISFPLDVRLKMVLGGKVAVKFIFSCSLYF